MGIKSTMKRKMAESESESESESAIFKKGSQVEVSTDEEGFEGSWFRATVLRPPSAKRKETLVEYHTLLSDEDESKLLQFKVDLACIRPLPPPNKIDEEGFEPNDVVDAWFNDGWWSGVVTKVVEESSRYSVFFEKPADEKEFERSDLRRHLDWIGGKWVRPRKKEVMIDDVEHQEQLGHACNSGNNPEVPIQLESSIAAKDNAEEVTHCSTNSRKYHMEQSTPWDEQSRSSAVTSSKKKIEQAAPDNDAKISRPSKKLKEGNDVDVLLNLAACQLRTMPIETSDKASLGAFASPMEGTGANCSEQPAGGDRASDKTESTIGDKEVGTMQQEVGALESQTTYRVERKERSLKTQVKIPPSSALSKKGNAGEDAEEVMQEKALTSSIRRLCRKKKVEQAVKRKRRARPPKLLVRTAKNTVAGSKDATREIASEVSVANCIMKEVQMALVEVPSTTADYDQPLPICLSFVDESSGIIINQLKEASVTQVDSATQYPGIEATGHSVSGENQTLPFVKSSPIWKAVESMKVFQKMPQKPHFHPLYKCNELYREGLALAEMIIFDSLLEKASKLQLDDPTSNINSILEKLHDLKLHGFDVKPVESRICRLLSIKYKQGQLQEQSKEVNSQILEHTSKGSKYIEVLTEIEGEILELEEKQATSMSLKQEIDSEIHMLQSSVNAMHEDIQMARREFESLAAAPF